MTARTCGQCAHLKEILGELYCNPPVPFWRGSMTIYKMHPQQPADGCECFKPKDEP